MREQDPLVPPEVEQYLIYVGARAGQIGGSLGGAIGGAGVGAMAGSRGGARGGARGAARLRTVVADRAVSTSRNSEEIHQQISEAFPRARRLDAEGHLLRLVIPVGMTGIQQIVVDIAPGDTEPVSSDVILVRAYGKEGLLSRKPTARIADQVAQLLAD